jgi:hypothetical protein
MSNEYFPPPDTPMVGWPTPEKMYTQAELDKAIEEAKQEQLEVIDAALVWFNATEQGFSSEIRPDVARAKFYSLAKLHGFLNAKQDGE